MFISKLMNTIKRKSRFSQRNLKRIMKGKLTAKRNLLMKLSSLLHLP